MVCFSRLRVGYLLLSYQSVESACACVRARACVVCVCERERECVCIQGGEGRELPWP